LLSGYCRRHSPQIVAAALIWPVLAALSAPAAAPAPAAQGGAQQPQPVAQEPPGFWTGNIDSPVPSTIHGGVVIHARELSTLLKQGAVVVDVSNAPRRPEGLAPGAPWMPVPHSALPGSLWIPGAGVGSMTPAFDAYFRARLAQATAGDLGRALAVYCHDRCWLSWNAAKRAIGYGYRRVYWFPEGIEGWRAAGLPTATVAAQREPESAQPPPARSPTPQLSQPPVPRPRLVVLDMELSGDLGGPEFTAEHAARLTMASARLRADLARTHLYELLDNAPAQDLIDRLKSQQLYLHECNGCDLDVGRQLGANLVMVTWVNRVSGLILTLTYEIHDVASGQIAARKSFDFRGDNDVAWTHAIDYMARDLQEAAAAAGTSH